MLSLFCYKASLTQTLFSLRKRGLGGICRNAIKMYVIIDAAYTIKFRGFLSQKFVLKPLVGV